MDKININREIKFKTARSGGKGGQNVNKVETMVEGYFDIQGSQLLNPVQKHRLLEKLANRINSEGQLMVKSQTERSQLGNKDAVVKKMNLLISQALVIPKKRVPTRPNPKAKENRIESKKNRAQIKEGRKKFKLKDL